MKTHEAEVGRLQDYVCIVADAGATSGEAIANRFVMEGARVVLATVQGGSREGGITRIVHDGCDEAQWGRLVAETVGHFGRLDVLVNASIPADGSTVENASREHIVRSGEIMVEAVALACKYALPAMHRSAGRAAVVNVAPSAGLIGMPENLTHALAGGAIAALTRSIAMHCFAQKYDIRCNAIFVAETADVSLRSAEIAAAAVYLASPESGYVNGHSIALDGGASSFVLRGLPNG